MAVTEQSYTGNGSTTNYSFTFPYLKSTDVTVQVDQVVTTAWTFANATTVQFNTAPANGAAIKILRDTSVDNLTATFYPGSAIKSEDLNDNFTQNLYVTQEVGNRSFENTGTSTMIGNLNMGEDTSIVFEGSTDDAHETTLTVADPTADRTITLPNVTGTVVTTGDTGTVTSAMITDSTIVAGDLASNCVTTAKILNSNVTSAKLADNIDIAGTLDVTGTTTFDGAVQIKADNQSFYIRNAANEAKFNVDSDNGNTVIQGSLTVIGDTTLANSSIGTAEIADNAVTAAKLGADTITGAKIADDSIDSEHYVNGSIDSVHIANSAVTATQLADNAVERNKILNDAVNGSKIADDSIDSEHYVDGSIDTAHIANDAITATQIADNAVERSQILNDAVNGSKIADDSIDSEHYVDGSIDAQHIANATITATQIQNTTITATQIADNAIERGKILNDAVNGSKIADDSIAAEHIADNAVGTEHIADAELTTLAGMQSGTASILAAGTTLTATLAEINTVVDGKGVHTTISDSDAHYPTSGAVVDYVAAQLAPVGGLEVIADDESFPETQPAAGVVISIADAGGLVVNGSGVSTTGDTITSNGTVTINNINSQFHNTTIAAGVGMQISSTGSGQIYNYHKALLKESDLANLSSDIDDFGNRYRVHAGEPSSNNDDGDLVWDTNADKMKVYDGTASAWKEVTSSGDFKFLVPVDAGTTTAATFDGSDTSFDLKETTNSGSAASITNVNQLMIVLNGVVQKPNTGTYSASEEGFYLTDSDTIRFCTAPVTGSTCFIVQSGSALTITTPGDNTVATAKIQNGAVTTDKVADNAITGAKVADNLDIPDNNKIRFGTGNDLEIYHDGSHTRIKNTTGDLNFQTDTFGVTNASNTENILRAFHNGSVDLYYDNVKKFETVSAGVEIHGNAQFDDNCIAKFGTGGDLEIKHDGTETWFKNTTGTLNFTNDGWVQFKNAADNETLFRAESNGSVELYYDNSLKFKTNNAGAIYYGTLNTSDTGKATYGSSDDLQIYHNGTDSKIRSDGHPLKLESDAITLKAYSNNDVALTTAVNGAVELYYDNVKSLETTATGCTISKAASAQNAELFIKSTNGGQAKIQLEAGGNQGGGVSRATRIDFVNTEVSTTPIWTLINDYDQNGTNDFRLAHGAEVALAADPDGAVELFHDGSKRLETTSAGVNIGGNLSSDSGQHFVINAGGASGTAGNVILRCAGENSIVGNANGSVDLYYDNTKKLATTDNGVDISNGYLTIDSGSTHGVQTLTDAAAGTSVFGYRVHAGSGNTITYNCWTNGNVENTNNSYGQISDEKLKENIVDAKSQWDDIKAIKIRNYNFKASTGYETQTQIGVVAQEVETVSAGLVYESGEGDDKKKAVKSSVLYMKAIKALQEAMAKIETLETKVAALEAK